MKGFISLLKGRKFRMGKVINSSFLLKNQKEEKENNFTQTDHYSKLINNINSKKTKLNYIQAQIKSKKNKINENYEDLFFYFLKNSEKIENFETSEEKKIKSEGNMFQIKINENKSQVEYDDEENNLNNEEQQKKRINIKKIFYHEIYLNFIKNKQQWKNFLFPKGIYNLFYQKSRKKQKEIFRFCIKNNYKYKDVIKSYDKIYTNKTLKHNWELSSYSAYINYVKINKKKNLSQSKENYRKNLSLYNLDLSDVVIKVNNKGEGRALIYIGKIFNIYTEDYLKKNKNNNNNIISMNLIEPKLRKEIVYTDTDLIKRIKIKQKMDYSYNNNSYNNLLYNNKTNYLNKKIKQNYNLHLIINNLNINKKTTPSSENKNIANYKRYNSELKEINNSSKLNIKNKKNISLNSIFNCYESYKNIFNNFSTEENIKKDNNNNKIENNKKLNVIYKKQIYEKRFSPKKVKFSPSSFKSYRPTIKMENYKNLNSNINNIIKPNYTKINLKNNEKQEIENKKSKNNLIYYFKKNNSDFYYL